MLSVYMYNKEREQSELVTYKGKQELSKTY